MTTIKQKYAGMMTVGKKINIFHESIAVCVDWNNCSCFSVSPSRKTAICSKHEKK